MILFRNFKTVSSEISENLRHTISENFKYLSSSKKNFNNKTYVYVFYANEIKTHVFDVKHTCFMDIEHKTHMLYIHSFFFVVVSN